MRTYLGIYSPSHVRKLKSTTYSRAGGYANEIFMAFSTIYSALEVYIDIPFNIWLSIILTLIYLAAAQHHKLLLAGVVVTTMTIIFFDRTSTAGELLKIICVLPLGLGSVLMFLVAGRSFRTRFLPAFTTYINFAVYSNILIMIGTPMGGTLRGLCSKVTCALLFVWIVQQGYRVRWKTVTLHDELLVFTAVSKSWIFAHAIYRFVLLTLPCFGSGRRQRLLEFYSLVLTYTLSWRSNLRFEYCFGMADTLVVPAVAGWSAISKLLNLVARDATGFDLFADHPGPSADIYLSIVTLAVAIFVSYNIARLQYWNMSNLC